MNNDKINHICAGTAIGLAVAFIPYLQTLDLFFGIWSALVAAAIGGGVKEWCDNDYSFSHWDWADFLCTIAGAGIIVLLLIGLHFGKG